VLELERETGFEPATLSLGMAPGESAGAVHGWQPSETRTLGGTEPTAASPGFATIRTREAPIEPHRTAQAARGGQKGGEATTANVPRAHRVSGGLAWLTVSEVAKELRVSSATVYRLIGRGVLQHTRVSTAIRISRADLATFLRGES
jgi:excisionase family DNA binding protein